MTQTKSETYNWLNDADPELLELDEKPLFGFPPEFPWGDYSSKLAELFQLETLKIEPDELRWRTREELYESLGDRLQPVNFSVSPLSGTASLVVNSEDIDYLMSSVLNRKPPAPEYKIDREFQQGFYNFIVLEAMQTLNAVKFDHTLTPHIIEEQELLQEPCLTLDIKISLFEKTVWGRILVDPKFRKSWKEYFSEGKNTSSIIDALSRQTPVTVHIEAGRVRMPYSKWSQVGVGDFVFLDRCTIDPVKFKGNVFLSLSDGTAVLEAGLKKGNLKIKGISQLQEVETAMEKDFDEQDREQNIEEEFAEEDSSMDEEEEEETETDFLDNDEDEEDEEEEDENAQVENNEEDEERSKETSGTELEEDEEEEESEEEEQDKEEETEAELKPFDAPPISPNEIPLLLSVEIGRMQLPMQNLLDLQPGNMLDLNISPEKEVSLVVNGKCVGKGELLKIGNTLGVRILEIG